MLKTDVLAELEWEPSINANEIGVAVSKGIVTLTGFVGSYNEKLAAEKAALRVEGVKAVAQEIQVKLAGSLMRTDEDIAEAALNRLKWAANVPDHKIKVKIENGWLTLSGHVDWNYQRKAAKNAVKDLIGIRGVSNLITINIMAEPSNIKEKIRQAFERNALIDADNVTVKIEGKKAILSGHVRSWAEKQQAGDTAWAAIGVNEVENNLKIKLQNVPVPIY